MDPQCSSSCGGGVQTRRVVCKQRTAVGSDLELPATFCPSESPPVQQACGRRDCPPDWVAAGWSQVGSEPRPGRRPAVRRP